MARAPHGIDHIAVFATSISAIVGPLVSGSLNRIMSRKEGRMHRSDHLVIVGLTALAYNTYHELKRRGQVVVLIAPQEQGAWNCRAGQNSLIVRVDGTLAPCFPLYPATHDWGTVGAHKFEVPQLNEMKKTCTLTCFSTWLATFCLVAPVGRLGAGFDWRQRAPALLVALSSCLELNHNLAMAYEDAGVIKYFFQQARHGFQGVTGSMDQS